jgi:gluconokinase
MAHALVVVMGVSGSGKSTIGRLLADALAVPYLEGDDVHSPENVARMRSGQALTDEQRRGWLETLSAHLARARRDGQGLVMSCSALKRSYRDVLRRGAPHVRLVHLKAEKSLLAERSAKRQGHYMPLSLLDSQFATLELPGEDEAALTYDVGLAPSEIVLSVLAALASQPHTDESPLS